MNNGPDFASSSAEMSEPQPIHLTLNVTQVHNDISPGQAAGYPAAGLTVSPSLPVGGGELRFLDAWIRTINAKF